MKSNFTDKLFEKQIDSKMAGVVTGGDCTIIEYTDGGSDSRTTTYDDEGNIKTIKYCD